MSPRDLDEDQLLEEFRRAVKDLNQNDKTLLRYLRARDYDLHQAEQILRNTVEWRQTHRVDEALTWEIPPKVNEAFPIEFPGVDYKNQAIMVIPLGSWPLREMVEAGYREDMARNIIVTMEKLVKEIEKTGEQFTFIVDMDGARLWTYMHYQTLQLCLSLFRQFEAHYPERLAEALVINTSYVFYYGWSFTKTILTGKTLSKVKFLGSNEFKYIPEILKRMPASSMPLKLQKLAKEKNIS